MSASEQQIESWLGRPVRGEGGEPLGNLSEVYLDEATGRPRWGQLEAPGREEAGVFVPVGGLREDGGELWLPVAGARVASAPDMRTRGNRLEPDQEEELARHYGIGGAGTAGSEPETRVHDAGFGVDPDSVTREHVAPDPAPHAREGLPELVRSEERLLVSKTAVPVERVRLIKRVVTETVTKTFEVRREELHVERIPVEPVAEGASGEQHGGFEVEARGEPFTGGEQEIVLLEEEVVITKRVVPRERVRLVTEVVTEDRHVTEDLQREEVELERAELHSRDRAS